MKPLVSIIVPVYNVEPYIRKCVDSLICQTLKDIQIILVDDGSTDSSGLICDEYKNKDNRIVVIHKVNEGLGLARNTGIEAATGEYIGFVDSDDFVKREMFEVLYTNAKKYSSDISYCDKIKWYSENQKQEIRADDEAINIYVQRELRKYLLDRIGTDPEVKKDTLYSTAVWLGIFKHQIIKENEIRFVSERTFISEDIIFNIDIISKSNRVVHSNKKMYYYRCTENSLTTKYKADRFYKNIVLYKEIIRKLEIACEDEDVIRAADRFLLTYARIACMQEVQFSNCNGKDTAIQRIKNVAKSGELVETLKRYPINKLPMDKQIFCYLLKYHCSGIIYYLLKWRMNT